MQQVEVKVSQLQLIERERRQEGNWHGNPKYEVRKDVYFDGQVTINGRRLTFDLHLMTSDGSLKEAKGKWHTSITINKPQRNELPGDWNEDDWAAVTTRCNACAEKDTATALAKVIFPKLRQLGYDIYETRNTGGWYLFDMHPDSVKSKGTKASWRRFYIKYVTEIVCPVHGKLVQEDEEAE